MDFHWLMMTSLLSIFLRICLMLSSNTGEELNFHSSNSIVLKKHASWRILKNVSVCTTSNLENHLNKIYFYFSMQSTPSPCSANDDLRSKYFLKKILEMIKYSSAYLLTDQNLLNIYCMQSNTSSATKCTKYRGSHLLLGSDKQPSTSCL